MRLGHEQRCEEIHRGGGAEQYNADKKYKEAVAEAVEACATDTKSESNILVAKGNLAGTYRSLGRFEECSRMQQDVYSGRLKLDGKEHEKTLVAAINYAASLLDLERFEEVRSLLRRTIPVARRVLGDNDRLTFQMRKAYAQALFKDDGATLKDLRKAVTTLEEIEPIARRVLGSAHPDVVRIENNLKVARAALRDREV